MKYLKRIALLVPFAPILAFAQGSFTPWSTGSGLGSWFGNFTLFINNILVPLAFALAFLVFVWGVIQYFLLGGGDEEKQTKGKSLMLYGIIGFVVMVSIWGIVNLISNSLFVDKDTIVIPKPATR